MAVLMYMTAVATVSGQEFGETAFQRRMAGKQDVDATRQMDPGFLTSFAAAAALANANCEPAAQPAGPPKNVIVAVPHYHYSRSDEGAGFEFNNMQFKSGKGQARGDGVTLVYNRIFSEVFSVGFMYEYTFMRVKSGAALPAEMYDMGARVYENSRWYSHGVGILPKFDFGRWGRFMPFLTLGYDRVSGGTESTYIPGLAPIHRDMNGDGGTDLGNIMLWYEKDFEVKEGFKLTPYAGSQNLHIKVRGTDTKMWAHFLSGGLKASYLVGKVNLSARAGIHHRTTHGEFAGWGSRIVAPGVAHFTHKATQDRTVGTFGAGAEFMVKRMLVGVNYDGWAGKDTSTHMGSLTLGLVF